MIRAELFKNRRDDRELVRKAVETHRKMKRAEDLIWERIIPYLFTIPVPSMKESEKPNE